MNPYRNRAGMAVRLAVALLIWPVASPTLYAKKPKPSDYPLVASVVAVTSQDEVAASRVQHPYVSSKCLNPANADKWWCRAQLRNGDRTTVQRQRIYALTVDVGPTRYTLTGKSLLAVGSKWHARIDRDRMGLLGKDKKGKLHVVWYQIAGERSRKAR